MSSRARSEKNLRRPLPKRDPYDRVLIVCEGSKTEPNYLRALIDDLKLNTANVEVDGNSGSSPKSVINYAKRRYKEEQENKFDRVYCVIDKDEHPTYQAVIADIKVAKPANVFYVITSVPCFEYWLYLHFTYTTSAYGRSGKRSPGECMKHDLRKYLPDYEEGSKNVYKQVMLHTEQAISNAKRAYERAFNDDTDNPSTQVHILVEYLRDLKHQKKRST